MQRIGVNGENYNIVRLLGKGKGGYSYLAEGAAGLCVIKQIHHEPCSYYTFGDKLEAELRDYQTLVGLRVPVPALYCADRPNERIVKEYIEGPTIYELALKSKVPEYCFDKMRELCRVLYAAGINIDYFPTNFIPRGGELYYVDYECSGYTEEWDFEHWGIKYWSRTPELLEYQALSAKGE